MEGMARRSALALGLAAAAAPTLLSSKSASAQQAAGPEEDKEVAPALEGKEIAPGVREVMLSQREAIIPGYKSVAMLDLVFQPGSHAPQETMEHDMVCHIAEGELRIVQDGREFRAKKNDVYTCAKGTTEEDWNEGDTVAVMRVTVLHSA